MGTNKRMTTIIVLEGNTSNGNLDLSDEGISIVKKREVVTWIIHPDSDVDCITAIPAKSGSPNVFSSGPRQLGNSKNWQGTIIPNVNKVTIVDYDIKWKDKVGKEYTFDPKLIINPGTSS